MAKRPIIQSDSEGSDDEAEKDLFPSAKRPKLSLVAAQSSGSGSSSDPDSDAEWTMDKGSSKKPTPVAKRGQKGGGRGAGGGGGGKGGGKTAAQWKANAKKGVYLPTSSDSSDDEDEGDDDMEGEEGQQSSDSGDSSSDSDSSENSLKFDDGLDDRLLGDEEDKKKLSLMTETERETEMYNRYERREALKARFEIEQRLIRQKKSMKKKSKEEKLKRYVRDKRTQKQDKSKSQAMDEYKAKRSADKIRKAEAEKQPDEKEKEPLKVSDVFSSESESEDSSSFSSDESGDDPKLYKPITSVSELAKIKISRYRLEKWVHMPFFNEAVTGCFVRIGIGAHEGRMVYRVCEILNVQETQKVYNLGSTKTNKGLKLRHGIQERIFRMEYVSNSPFLDSEFTKWAAEMDKRELKLPTVDFVQRKVKELDKFKNTTLKEEDVEKIVQEKQRFRKNPRNYAMTKSRLIREKDLAEQEGDTDKTRSLAEKLQELEERADQLDKQRTKGLSAISYINERNRQRNVVRAEKALKEELAATEGKEDDPFTRRKCQPTLVTLAVRDGAMTDILQQLSQKSTPTKEPKAGKSDVEETPNGQKLVSGIDGTPSAGVLSATPIPPPPVLAEQVNDLFSAHDFDIQIDLPSGDGDSSTPKSLSRPTTAPKQDGPKRSLNLADYKKRRGLI